MSWSRVGVGFDGTQPTAQKWYPANKGGIFRRWYGNSTHVMNWLNDGHEIRNLRDESGRQLAFPRSLPLQFKPHLACTRITPSQISFRWYDAGYLFTDSAVAIFCEAHPDAIHGFLNTPIIGGLAKQISPTLNFQGGDIAKMPVPPFRSAIRWASIPWQAASIFRKVVFPDWLSSASRSMIGLDPEYSPASFATGVKSAAIARDSSDCDLNLGAIVAKGKTSALFY